MINKNKFSYIVPMCNHDDNIGFKCRLKNINKMLKIIPEFVEVILVEQIVNSNNKRFIDHIKYPKNLHIQKHILSYEKFNKPWCTNYGVRSANSNFLLLAEMDILVEDKKYFTRLYNYIQSKELFWCYGSNDIIYLDKDYNKIKQELIRPGGPEGGIVFCRKEFYWYIGGGNEFIEGIGGPDNDYATRFRFFDKGYGGKFNETIKHQWHQRKQNSFDDKKQILKNRSIVLKMMKNDKIKESLSKNLKKKNDYLGRTDGPITRFFNLNKNVFKDKKLNINKKENKNDYIDIENKVKMGEIKILSREKTHEYLSKRINNNKRIVVSRYSDGEAILLGDIEGRHISDPSLNRKVIVETISYKKQFVCINELKEVNYYTKDRWYETQMSLIKNSKHKLYGNCNWNIYDYINGSDLLSKLFKGKILFCSGYAEDVKKKLNCCDMDIYSVEKQNASKDGMNHVKNIRQMVKENNYDNIILSCGPLSKILIPFLEPICKSNIIDFGALSLALIDKTETWTMSWAEAMKSELPKLNEIFIEKIKKENERS